MQNTRNSLAVPIMMSIGDETQRSSIHVQFNWIPSHSTRSSPVTHWNASFQFRFDDSCRVAADLCIIIFFNIPLHHSELWQRRVSWIGCLHKIQRKILVFDNRYWWVFRHSHMHWICSRPYSRSRFVNNTVLKEIILSAFDGGIYAPSLIFNFILI